MLLANSNLLLAKAHTLLSNENIPDIPWQVVAGMMIFTTALITWTRRRTSKSRGDGRLLAARNRTQAMVEHAGGLRPRSSEAADVLLELEQFARETSAQIDTRTRKLELLLRDVDQRIAELDRMMPQVSTGVSGSVATSRETRASAPR